MGSLGLPELIIIGVIALLIFGPKKLPELGSGLGKAIRDFKGAMSEPDEPAKPELKAKEEKKEEKAIEEKNEEKKEAATTKTT
jgi:sec-independent protein translocase protein TatA